jgi:short-subunit dehydrogenase
LATPAGGVGIYGTTKHAIVALSEALMHDLRPHGMHAVVICPGCVATNIAAADRNQPQGKPADDISSPDAMTREVTRLIVSQGLSPAAVADQTFAALEERRFYVITHPEYKHVVEMRHRQIEGAMTGEPATDVEFIKMQEAAAAAAQMEPLT